MKKQHTLFILFFFTTSLFAQENWNQQIDDKLPQVISSHRTFVSIPNLPSDIQNMYKNVAWVKEHYRKVGFELKTLESSTLPVLFAERIINPAFKTLLFYFHLDGQAVNPKSWDQKDPFQPVIKEQNEAGQWNEIAWSRVDEKMKDDWRIFGRAAADDKAPIVMFLSALELLQSAKQTPKFNIKIIFDLEEEYGSNGFLSSLQKYKKNYLADYMIIMDGPDHNSNEPTLTLACRGVANCSSTTYGSKLPQHSGHYGNYVPNPVFRLSRVLSSMKSENGKVLINDYYKGITINDEVSTILKSVPDNKEEINNALMIFQQESVGENYQESLQYPSLNVRQIETSWKGKALKTIIPEYATAHLDIRLVEETDGKIQLEKIKKHIKGQGYLVLDRAPTDKERLSYDKIATFKGNSGVNAFRTALNDPIGEKLRSALTNYFGKEPVSIRTMGGTVPIIPAINELDIPAIIVPMVNMDNNQHNPNENIRIGNIRQGIKICLAMLNTSFNE